MLTTKVNYDDLPILSTISLLVYFSGVSFLCSPSSSVKKLHSKINNIRKGAAHNT